MKKIIILGITGSIGRRATKIIEANPNEFQIVGFSFHNNLELGLELVEKLHPLAVAVKDENIKKDLKKVEVFVGEEGLTELIDYFEDVIVLNALVGFVGLKPTLKALEKGFDVLLANKESLVVGGSLVKNALAKSQSKLVPIDSEHSALLQALVGEKKSDIKKLIITCSGGALRDYPLDELKDVKKEAALKHPNWQMGNKITIDCATLMNKAFEVAEAYYLFDIDYRDIEVVLHKESFIHGLVLYKDYTAKAIMSKPDMAGPIAYALNYPNGRLALDSDFSLCDMTFGAIDEKRYPCFYLALEAFKRGNIFPCVLNASNEGAVSLFLNDKIGFLDIYKICEEQLKHYQALDSFDYETLAMIDKKVKEDISLRYGG